MNSRMKHTVASLMAATMIVGGAQPAAAQAVGNFVRDKAVSVRERPHPEYTPRGLRAGAFGVDAQVRVAADASDNLYGTDTGEVSDAIIRVSPSVTATSNWSRHELQLYANADIERYLDVSTENNESWQVGGRGELDILRNAKATGTARFAHFVEPRTSSNTVALSAVPIEYDQSSLGLSGYREFNRVRITGTASWDRFEYDNGVTSGGATVDQSYRDRDVMAVSVKGDYALTPDTALFVQVRKDWHDYDNTSVFDRNSDGLQIIAGADFELSNTVRGQFGIGWLRQSFDDPAFSEFSGLSANGQVEWFVTQLSTVTFNASRTVDDSGLAGTSGIVSDQFRLTLDHELLRNVIVSGNVGYEENDFLDFGRQDNRTSFGLAATYLMNRGVGVFAGYSHLDQRSSGVNAGPDFSVNRASVGLIFRY